MGTRSKAAVPNADRPRAALAYRQAKERAKARSGVITLAGQEIAPVPPVGNPGRRARADSDFKFFCETYFPHLSPLAIDRLRALRVPDAPASAAEGRAACQGPAWASDHPRVVAKIERVVRDHETLAVAMPRGSGKTTLCLVAVQWPILSGQGGFNSEMQRGWKSAWHRHGFSERCHGLPAWRLVPARRGPYDGRLTGTPLELKGTLMAVSKETLAVLRSVRTSDVADALDSLGRQQRCEMDPAMRPLYPGIRFAGIAHTVEYDVVDKPLGRMSYEEFDERQYKPGPEGLWHEAGPWGGPDEVLVIDAKGTRAGILGSSNTLGGRVKGVAGYVIDGTCRDSAECILQKTPAFCTVRSPAHPMGRIGPVSDNRPITCAGVRVAPGDPIVADDDGVMVVPQDLADEVARRAKLIQEKDRPSRRKGYEALGLPLDETVE